MFYILLVPFLRLFRLLVLRFCFLFLCFLVPPLKNNLSCSTQGFCIVEAAFVFGAPEVGEDDDSFCEAMGSSVGFTLFGAETIEFGVSNTQ